ncbi:MAG: dihydrodipicolinate synthase family protein, partial [Chloroflexi bacterium]|nr:dihydrodipicolinate synthase family protein [Chloroflexota bacterium]
MIRLSGVFPPIPTPFQADGALDLTALEENARWWRTVGFSGVVVLGSNGEYVALREREKLAMIQRTRELFPPDQLVIAGTGAESTLETIDLCCAAATCGADAVIVVTPHYYRSRMGE